MGHDYLWPSDEVHALAPASGMFGNHPANAARGLARELFPRLSLLSFGGILCSCADLEGILSN